MDLKRIFGEKFTKFTGLALLAASATSFGACAELIKNLPPKVIEGSRGGVVECVSRQYGVRHKLDLSNYRIKIWTHGATLEASAPEELRWVLLGAEYEKPVNTDNYKPPLSDFCESQKQISN